jgi:hypothetical protein
MANGTKQKSTSVLSYKSVFTNYLHAFLFVRIEVKHLKFSIMKFMNLLRAFDFLWIHNIQRECCTKIYYLSTQE